MPISDHQSTSIGLKRAGDPDSLNRVAGLELGLRAVNGAWPVLTCRGGVRAYSPTRMLSVADGGGWEPESFRTIAASDLGSVVVPSGSAGTPTETSSWGHIKLDYADIDATLSRATPAMLLEWSATSLRLCSGTVTKRTTNGTAVTETATQNILPKYVGYHTSGGYQVGTISTTPIDLSGMNQPWIMVWWGDQSHWCDTTRNLFYGVNSGHAGTRGHPESDAFQADAPLLLVFSSNPTQIVRDGTAASGFDLTFSSGAKKLSIMPLYGRERLDADTTDTWTTGGDLPQSKIAAVYPTLGYFPSEIQETYAYDSGTDTATITEAVTWTTVLASGGSKFCPLPVVLGNARDTDLPITLSDAVTDLDIPTEYGPTQGIAGVDEFDWSISGLAAYTAARPSPGSGSVPSRLQDDFDAEVDKLVSEDHWEPWIFGTRLPNGNVGGDLYYKNQADTLAQASEALPFTSGARRTALLDWLAAEQAAYPAESSYNISATDGAERGPAGIPGSHAAIVSSNPNYTFMFQSRQWIWAAWGLARYHQESGVSIPTGLVDDLLAILDLDMAEQDWATGHWFAGHGDRQLAVENASRHLAGLIGLAWLCEQEGHADEGEVRALLAKAVVTRVAMAHLPRWQASVGLLTYPSDPDWTLERVSYWQGAVFTTDWVDAMDDPCVPVKFDQYHTYLADSTEVGFGWLSGGAGVGKAPAYRGFVKPAADLLKRAVPGEGEIYAVKTRELIPYWWLPFREANLAREASVAQPMDTYGLFLAKAYLESPQPDDLLREAAYPWLENGGDLMTLHKMAEAMRAYTGDAVVTLLSDTFTDANGTDLADHTPEVGGPWVTRTGAVPGWYDIQGNRANSTVVDGGIYADVGTPNVRATMKLDVGTGNLMSFRMASAEDDFTGGMRARLNKTDDVIDVFGTAGSVIATADKTIAASTEYDVEVTQYRGHVAFTVGGTLLHVWNYDYNYAASHGFDYSAKVPTGTRVGPDWTSTSDGYCDDLVVQSIPRSAAVHYSCIGDSITPFNPHSGPGWPVYIGEHGNGGVTQVRAYCGGGEGLSVGGSSGNTAREQAQLVTANVDDPNYVIIHIGTNDNPDAVALTGKSVQTLMEEFLDELIIGGGIPQSKIRALSILPRVGETYHPDNRVEIAAACASRSVTLWDTSTWGFDPTIDVHTIDGLHPNQAGHDLIGARILGLLAAESYTAVSDVSDSGTVAKRATFSVTFQSNSSATNTYPQYHATHNPDGQSHDVEFSDDSFATVIVRPVFFETVYDYIALGTDWYEPSGVTQWRANFAPPRSGSWQYRIRSTDANGESLSDAVSFTVTSSSHKGRVRVSADDPRYFEYEDGSLFLPRGYNQTYDRMPFSNPAQAGAAWAAGHADAGVNLVRIWLTHWAGTSTEGSTWTNTRFDADRNIYVNPDGQPLLTPYGDHQMAAYVTAGYSTIAWDWNKQSVNVRPDTTYRVRLRYQIPFDMTASNGALPYGLTFKTSATWIINYDTEPTEPGKGTAHITPEHATTGDGTAWAEISGTFTTGGSQYFLDQAFVVLENCSDGIAFIDHLWIEEDLGGGEYGPNLVGSPSFGAPSHNVNGEWMRRFSDLFAHIEATDLKLVLTTSPRATDWYLGVMDDDGELVAGGVDDGQWAGPDGGKQRFFHQAWAREVMARFGHSPALFSMEFVNEMNPGSSRARAAAEDYCAYLKGLGDAPLVSTSHSGTLPRAAWDAMPSADYTDLHCYQFSNVKDVDITVYDTDNVRVHATADWEDSAAWIARVNDTCGVHNSTLADVRPVLLGEGAMGLVTDPEGSAPSVIAVSSDVAAKYWTKRLWVGKVHPGGVAEIGEWLPATTLYPSFDHRDLFGAVGGVVETIPLNEGGYVDISATCPTGLRAYGQKKTSTGSAIIFIDNEEDTYKAVADSTTPTPRSGDVTFAIPAGDYTVTPVDTTDGTLGSPETLTSDGTLTLPITSLSTDVAYLIAGPGAGSFDGPGSIITMGLATDLLITQGYGEVAMPVTGNVITGGLGTDLLITQGYGETTPIAGDVITLGLGTDLLITQGYSSTSSEPTIWTGTGSATAAATASATGFAQTFGTGTASASASASGTGTVQAFGTGTATARATASGVGTGGTALSRPQTRGRFPLLARFRLRF